MNRIYKINDFGTFLKDYDVVVETYSQSRRVNEVRNVLETFENILFIFFLMKNFKN